MPNRGCALILQTGKNSLMAAQLDFNDIYFDSQRRSALKPRIQLK
jgi:hypothetical protein